MRMKFRFYWKNGGQGVHNLCLQIRIRNQTTAEWFEITESGRYIFEGLPSNVSAPIHASD
jgi:hypothetical protein